MALRDDKPRVIEALRTLPDVKAVLDAWPERVSVLPTIIVEEARNSPADRRDDREYLTRLEYYIRIFTKHAKERSSLASAADDLLLTLGYERNFNHETGESGMCVKHMRYYIYV